jgi:hypothetical protein
MNRHICFAATLLAVGLLTILSPPDASADTIYTYQQNGTYAVVSGQYTNSMFTTGWIELSNPIAPINCVTASSPTCPENILPDILDFSFNDGLHTITDGKLGATFSKAVVYFASAPDAVGLFEFQVADSLGSISICECEFPGASVSSIYGSADVPEGAGQLTLVPEPTTLSLFTITIGLTGLGLWLHRQRPPVLRGPADR